MELAGLYARVSTVEQANTGVSLDAQTERLFAYCSGVGLQPVRVIREEPISAGKPLALRPGGKKLLQALAEGEVNNVVALKLDRLFRSTQDALTHITQWDTEHVTLHLCDMGGQHLNTASAMGRMMLTLLASFAEFERNLISERTAAALAHKKSKRQAYNQTPYGFRKEGKMLVPDEQEQRVLQHIFTWRQEGHSLWVIANRLNHLGIPAKKGGRWHGETIRNMLRNDLYREVDNVIEMPRHKPNDNNGQSAETKLMNDLLNGIRGLGEDEPS
jgi:site-specific DNA recombinase